MQKFIDKHRKKITGVISSFDRIIFKGYLPVRTADGMAAFLGARGIRLNQFREFAFSTTEKIKEHALKICKRHQRPYNYFNKSIDKSAFAQKVAENDDIKEGLICVIAVMEQNASFEMRGSNKKYRLVPCKPRCLTMYYYFNDPVLGFIHVRIPTWLPFSIQVYVNGNSWLEKKLCASDISYNKVENAFVHIDDCDAAQKIADTFVRQKWEKILHTFAKRLNPFMKTLLKGMEYYWVIDQAEYATDVIFRSPRALGDLFTKLQTHTAVCISPRDILTYLERQRPGAFAGEQENYYQKRRKGTRVKHRVNGNWIKMYDKHGVILRIEMVINSPYEFSMRRRRKKKGAVVLDWFPMLKRVTAMYRFAEVSLAANYRYLNMLAAVDDPSTALADLRKICKPAKIASSTRRPLNPLRPQDFQLLEAVLKGKNAINGLRHADVAKHLKIRFSKNKTIRQRQSARVSRRIHLLRAHKIIAKIPHTRKYHPTVFGMRIAAAVISIKEIQIPFVYNMAA
jgi:hypothetical protein